MGASSGDCLTFSAVGGALQSAGVDCDTQLMPLCFRESGASDLSFFNNQCSQCSDTTAEPSCHQWVNLENYPTKDFTITGAEICVKPCGPPVPFEDEYCQAIDPQAKLFNYHDLVLEEDDVEKIFGVFINDGGSTIDYYLYDYYSNSSDYY